LHEVFNFLFRPERKRENRLSGKDRFPETVHDIMDSVLIPNNFKVQFFTRGSDFARFDPKYEFAVSQGKSYWFVVLGARRSEGMFWSGDEE
jgi:hypothetical protein